jgi:hypothetical protein
VCECVCVRVGREESGRIRERKEDGMGGGGSESDYREVSVSMWVERRCSAVGQQSAPGLSRSKSVAFGLTRHSSSRVLICKEERGGGGEA